MNAASPRKILIQCRSVPYGSSRARNALDMAMAFGAFDQNVALLFLGDGVMTLLKEQQPEGTARNIGKLLGALADYGIGTVHVDRDALAAYGLMETDFCVPVTLVHASELAALYADTDIVLTV